MPLCEVCEKRPARSGGQCDPCKIENHALGITWGTPEGTAPVSRAGEPAPFPWGEGEGEGPQPPTDLHREVARLLVIEALSLRDIALRTGQTLAVVRRIVAEVAT